MVALSEQWIICTAMGAVQAVMVDDGDGVLTICPATSIFVGVDSIRVCSHIWSFAHLYSAPLITLMMKEP